MTFCVFDFPRYTAESMNLRMVSLKDGEMEGDLTEHSEEIKKMKDEGRR
jgi:hypothetical protein